MSSRPPRTFPDFDDVDTDPRAHLLLDIVFGEDRPSRQPPTPKDDDDASAESASA